MFQDDDADGLTWVGRPLELVRALDSVYLDQARANLPAYVATTLRYSQLLGGRYNPPGEFGALYTTDDEATAWEEIAARFRPEGIPGLPPDMGLLGILVPVGRYADLTDRATQAAWEIDAEALKSRQTLSGMHAGQSHGRFGSSLTFCRHHRRARRA